MLDILTPPTVKICLIECPRWAFEIFEIRNLKLPQTQEEMLGIYCDVIKLIELLKKLKICDNS